MFHDQGGCSHSLGKHRGIKQKIKNHFYELYDTEVSPVDSHRILSVKALQSLTAGRGWAEVLGGDGAVAPARGSTWSDKLWARTCCAPPELHRHRAASLGPESSELGSPARIKAPALQQECKSALKWKGSDVCHSWLSQQGSWLSGYIPKEPQPAASPEREARPLEQTCQQQLYKKK